MHRPLRAAAPQASFPSRLLAWLADWMVVILLVEIWVTLIPWLQPLEEDIPWPLSEVLLWALGGALVAGLLILVWTNHLGRRRCSLGMAIMGLGTEDCEGHLPSRGRMLGRLVSGLAPWLTLGLGNLPICFGRRSLQDVLSGTRVVDRGRAHPLLSVLLCVVAPLLVFIGLVLEVNHLSAKATWIWGYLDRSGRVLIEPRFQEAKPFQSGRALVRHEGVWRWVGRSGRLYAELGAFDACVDQIQGLAAFMDRRVRTTCMDAEGGIVAQSSGDVYLPSEAGLPFAVEGLDDRAGFRRPDGSSLTAQVFDEAWPFSEGLGRFRLRGKMGAVDTDGRMAIPPTFDEIRVFSRGVAPARVGRRWGLLNPKGRWTLPPTFEALGSFSLDGSGLRPARRGGRWGYLRQDGTWGIRPRFDQASGFNEVGWALAKVGEGWGVINVQAEWVVEPRFEELRLSREAPFAFRRGIRWGYVTPGGRVVVAPVFSRTGTFQQGCAFAKGVERWFRVEATGCLTPLPRDWELAVEGQDSEGEPIPFAMRVWRRP